MKKILKNVVIVILTFALLTITTKEVNASSFLSIDIDTIDEMTIFTGVFAEFSAKFQLNVKSDSSIPQLKIQIGNGEIKTISEGTIQNNEIVYEYKIEDEDQGLIKLISYEGNVTFEDGTTTKVEFSDLRKL